MISEAQAAAVQSGRIEVLIEQLRKGVAEDPSLAASVLRTWLAEARTR
jgi:flagellar biosynthesis/type III secretory pathway M-ring protein FliF/YscJ